MKKILLLFSFFTALAVAQTFSIKQITNLDADCRNINCGGYDRNSNNVYYTFEARKGNSSNIYLGQYSPYADSFDVVTKVTDNNFLNINPKLLYLNDSIFIVYQTNMNGNWDIACRVYFNNQLGPAYFVSDSVSDETNPIISTINEEGYYNQNSFVAYERGNSVFIKDVHASIYVEIEAFHGDDSTKYSQATRGNDYQNSNFIIAARKIVNDKPSIVYKDFINYVFGNEIEVTSSGNCRNPKIQDIKWFHGLSYVDDINGKSNIILIEQLSLPADTLKLAEYPLYDYDSFQTQVSFMLTKTQFLYLHNPYTYTAFRNDSLFIRLNKLDLSYTQNDTLIYTKVNINNLYLGSFGFTSDESHQHDYTVNYTIWSDSIAGNIQLLGKRYRRPLDGINDNYSPLSFTLFQNYPNPFNPATVINFKLLLRDKVILNVYDIMGRQVCTLVNEDKPAGEYSISFDSRKYNLSSGVYFYRLTTGGFSSVKKMILIK
jgi:hypothetical protein